MQERQLSAEHSVSELLRQHAAVPTRTAEDELLQRVEFPLISYYGVLRGFVLEVPQQPCSSATSRRLFQLLEQWSRQGGGQSWKFGVTWSERQVPPATQIRLLADGGAPQQQPPPVAPAAAGGNRRSAVSAMLAPNRVWYGEYVEAFSDAMHYFFSSSATSHGHAAPPTMYVELRRHSRWRDVAVMLFYEGGVSNMYVATSHRPTQRFITQRAEEVDVVVEWIDGATLVSSGAPPQHPAAANPKGDAKDDDSGVDSGYSKRRHREKVDPCHVLAEIVLNLDLLTTLSSTTAHNTASGAPLPPMASPQLPPSAEVCVTASFPFLHGSWQWHSVRPQHCSIATSDATLRAAAASTHHFFISAACADGAMEVPHQHTSSSGGGGDDLLHLNGLLVSSKCVSCFTRVAPLLGPSLHSLLSVLIDAAKLDKFTLRFQPWQTFRAAAAAPPGSAAGSTSIGVGLSVVGRAGDARRGDATSASGSRAASRVVVMAQAQSGGEPSNGLCYSRLSTSSWLQAAERAVVAANAAGNSSDADDDDPASINDDVEAEFYPLSVSYHRQSLVRDGLATGAAAGGWGASFVLDNAITLMFGGDG
jgi:hypothetical protein